MKNFTQEKYSRARYEHAMLLKLEGLSFSEIGERFGFGPQRAGQLVKYGGMSLAWGTRRCKFKLLTSNQKETPNDDQPARDTQQRQIQAQQAIRAGVMANAATHGEQAGDSTGDRDQVARPGRGTAS